MRLTPDKFTQSNRSDVLGVLQGSFNINLTENLGKLRATRMLRSTTQATNTYLTSYPVGFRYFNDGGGAKIWTVAGLSNVGYPHSSASAVANATFSVDGTANTPTDCDSTLSDIEVFLGKLYVTANGKLYQNTAASWVNNSFSGAGPWPMTTFGARLYIGIGGVNKIFSTADGTTIATSSTNTIDFGDSGASSRLTFLRNSSNRIWIGTVFFGGKGYVHEWDGVSATQVTRSYRLESNGALACAIKDDIPWIVDTNGRLCVLSGGTFKEVARFPISDASLKNATNTVNNRFIHPNGMSVINGKINILINNEINDSATSTKEFCPSGVWEYDENIGLYHKYSLSYTATATTTVTDWGQQRVSGVGGLSDMKLPNSASNATGNFVAGATLYTNSSSTDAGIFVNDTFETSATATQQAAYFVTEKIYSQNITDTWQKIYLFYKKLLNASNKFVVKYRISDVPPTESSITWVDTTHFTYTATSAEISANSPAYAIKDEVEITQGPGSGLCAHITDIHFSGSTTISVTIDETATGVTTETAKARFQKWIKLLPTVTDQTSQFKEIAVGQASRWIQFKVFMIFKGIDEFEGMEIVNAFKQPNA